jgi:DNA replication protein DnaC
MTRASDGAVTAQVKRACRELHLPTVGARATAIAEDAARGGATHLAFLAAVLEAECEDRAERRRARRILEARFPRLKRLDDFRFEDAPGIPVGLVRDLATCRFVERAEPVIFLGESGTGKSHLAVALGVCACLASHKVRFTTTAALVNELLEARDERSCPGW